MRILYALTTKKLKNTQNRIKLTVDKDIQYLIRDELFGSELGLAFVIVGVLLFVVEVFQPGFLIAVPATVFIALGVLLSFNIVDGLLLLPIGLAVGLGSLYGTMMLYQSLAPPDTPSEMSIEGKIGERGGVAVEQVEPRPEQGRAAATSQITIKKSIFL